MFNLNQNKIDLKTLKDKVIRYLLHEQEKLGFIKSQAQYENEYERLKESINSNTMVMELREQNGRTDIEKINNTIREIYIDLLTAFEQMNAVSSTIDKHRKLNNSIISNIKTKLAQIEDEVTMLEEKLLNKSNDLFHIENFRSTDSFETKTELYTDKEGNQVSDSYRVSYDKYNECIRLPKLISINKLISVNGQKMAVLKINKQLGNGLINIKNPNNSLEKAIDTDMESYWEETIMTDTPIKVELDEDKYYKVGFGAVCELEVIFNNVVEINEISFLPFGQFPMEILAIKYYHTDQPDEEERKIINKKGNLKSIEIISPTDNRDIMIKDSVSYQFPSIAAKRLRILLNQPHYIKNSFIYDKRENEKNNIWFNKDNDINFNVKATSKSIYEDKALTDKSWILMNKAIEKQGNNVDIEELLFPKQTELIPVTKYEYNYGLYNLAINENNYKNMGIYVSKSISFNSNIGEAVLITEEEKSNDNCNIEYFISVQDNPTGADWTPIQPNTPIDFRSMLANGLLKTPTNKEKFFGTSNGTLTLVRVPFIDYKKLTSAISISIIDNLGKTLQAENITDYLDPTSSYKNFNKDKDTIQYYFYKNKIYFNTNLSKDYIIEVNYQHFINSVRLKAIFERTENSDNGISPILKWYKLLFKTIK